MMKQQILIVDDEPMIRYVMTFVLTNFGYGVTEAADGIQALALILEAQEDGDPFDLLVTDIQMPEMSGLELIRELKRSGLSLPIIAVSGKTNEQMSHELQNNGCAAFLMKPFDLRELKVQLQALLEKAETG